MTSDKIVSDDGTKKIPAEISTFGEEWLYWKCVRLESRVNALEQAFINLGQAAKAMKGPRQHKE